MASPFDYLFLSRPDFDRMICITGSTGAPWVEL